MLLGYRAQPQETQRVFSRLPPAWLILSDVCAGEGEITRHLHVNLVPRKDFQRRRAVDVAPELLEHDPTPVLADRAGERTPRVVVVPPTPAAVGPQVDPGRNSGDEQCLTHTRPKARV